MARKAYDRDYRQKHRERLDTQTARWRASHREQHLASMRSWAQRNPERRKNAHLKAIYGITLAEYNQLLEAQGGVCAICGRPERRVKFGKVMPLHIDHCHEARRVRGLLCHACNSAIGLLGEDPERLGKAIGYLRKVRQT